MARYYSLKTKFYVEWSRFITATDRQRVDAFLCILSSTLAVVRRAVGICRRQGV